MKISRRCFGKTLLVSGAALTAARLHFLAAGCAG